MNVRVKKVIVMIVQLDIDVPACKDMMGTHISKMAVKVCIFYFLNLEGVQDNLSRINNQYRDKLSLPLGGIVITG